MSPAQVAEAVVDQARALDLLTVLRRHSNVKLRKQRRELVGPCPRCGGTDRFAIRGELFNCRGCGTGGKGPIDLEIFLGGGEFVDAVKRLAGEADARLKHAPPVKVAKAGGSEYAAEQHRKAAWLWSQRRPTAGTPAETYLRRRGITCALPPTLGFLPPSKPEHHPAMIAAFALVDEPDPGTLGRPRDVQSVHLTLLKPDGSGKADVPKPKLMVGSPGDLPVVLAPPNDLLGLAITEGIEDAITVHEATGLGAWAAGAAGRMPKLAPLAPT
jgi:putative DNA primase/helicase